jgi:hypothetical protein
MTAVEIVHDISFFGGAVVVLAAVWRVFKPTVQLAATIKRIGEEFKPNGGNSLRDRINNLSSMAANAVDASNTAAQVARDMAAKYEARGKTILEIEHHVKALQSQTDRQDGVLGEIVAKVDRMHDGVQTILRDRATKEGVVLKRVDEGVKAIVEGQAK